MMKYLSRAQVREIDRRATTGFGVPSILLMENAGRGCADLLMRLAPDRKPVMILCGPGNNGGDGFVIARHLDNHGWPVNVQVFAKCNNTPGDADINFDILFTAGISFIQYHPEHTGQQQIDFFRRRCENHSGWMIDALFGTGLSRPMQFPFVEVIEAITTSHQQVLSIDIPSGLDCDTGEPLGPCVKATHTATFVAPKLGFKNPKSKEFTGEVHVIDIGIPQKLLAEYS